MDKCINPRIGRLITQYELGRLSDKDCNRFEEHLINCDYCSKELEEMESFSDSVRENKAEILEILNKRGINYEVEKRKFLAQRRSTQVQMPLVDHIRQFLQGFWQPRIYVPVLVTASIFIFVLILPRTPQDQDNPYFAYLNFEKAPYLQMRAFEETEGQQLFIRGMEEYLDNDYGEAISYLAKATKINPGEGEWWLYLGVSYYLDHQAGPGIESLSKADSLTVNTSRNRARWYLAQAYLLSGDAQTALPLLEALINQEEEYASEAYELLTKIKAEMEKNSSE